MGSQRTRAVVLDAGALIAFERNDARIRTLVELAMTHGSVLHTPAGVVGQVWRDGARQVRIARLLSSNVLCVQQLDREEAQTAGVLCGKSKTRDVIDASVVLLGRRYRAKVITSDPRDLLRIDPSLDTVTC